MTDELLQVRDLSIEFRIHDTTVRLVGDPGPGNPIKGQVFVHPSETGGVLTQLVQG